MSHQRLLRFLVSSTNHQPQSPAAQGRTRPRRCDTTSRPAARGPARPFPLEGEDWFDLADGATLSWAVVQATLESAHDRLATTVAEIGGGRRDSPLAEDERFALVLGITGHAAYHAGQIQLIKKLLA